MKVHNRELQKAIEEEKSEIFKFLDLESHRASLIALIEELLDAKQLEGASNAVFYLSIKDKLSTWQDFYRSSLENQKSIKEIQDKEDDFELHEMREAICEQGNEREKNERSIEDIKKTFTQEEMIVLKTLIVEAAKADAAQHIVGETV